MKFLRRGIELVRFQLEQFIVRGTLSRLIVIALAMVLIAVVAGLIAYAVLPRADYGDRGAAMWWAFLRLTDSGYLGDDEGVWLRTISTTLTVLGVVLFVGALIATMTQWLDDTIETLEAGYTPIAKNDHLLILGWNNRTAEMVEQLLVAEGRVARFLRARGAKRLTVVVLAQKVSPALTAELRDVLGRRYRRRHIILRSGSALRTEHLKRVDYAHAGAIVLPAAEFDAGGAPDERTIKTLMSAASANDDVEPADLPLIVAEIFDADLLETARQAYPGPAEIIGTAEIIARLIVQNTRYPGLAEVYNELLAGHDQADANRLFVPEPTSAQIGQPLSMLAGCYPTAILIGVARGGRFFALYDDDDLVVEAGDRLALIARGYDDCEPAGEPARLAARDSAPVAAPHATIRSRRVLVLGWNQKLPSLLKEFDSLTGEHTTIDVCSLLPIAEREALLAQRGIDIQHLALTHHEFVVTSYAQLSRLDLVAYDTVILVASDWLGSAEAADARLLLSDLVVKRALSAVGAKPTLIVETMDEDNVSLFEDPQAECLVSPVIQSNLLTQVALRRELHWVIEDIFGAHGAEVVMRPAVAPGASDYEASFDELAARAAAAGEILLGTLHDSSRGWQADLNPVDRGAKRRLTAADRLVVVVSEPALAPEIDEHAGHDDSHEPH